MCISKLLLVCAVAASGALAGPARRSMRMCITNDVTTPEGIYLRNEACWAAGRNGAMHPGDEATWSGGSLDDAIEVTDPKCQGKYGCDQWIFVQTGFEHGYRSGYLPLHCFAPGHTDTKFVDYCTEL